MQYYVWLQYASLRIVWLYPYVHNEGKGILHLHELHLCVFSNGTRKWPYSHTEDTDTLIFHERFLYVASEYWKSLFGTHNEDNSI